MDRDDLIQRTKEIAFSLNALETPIIGTIVQKSYPIENIVSERELYMIIDNVKRSGVNIKSTMPLSELAATLSSSISTFKKADWTKGKMLGEGTFGEVFEMTKGNEKIAFKELKRKSSEISQDSVREIGSYAILTAIGSKNIPQMIGFNTKGKFGFAMELADTDLWKWQQIASYSEKVANLPKIVDMLLAALSDIQSARLINGDFKPGNMLIWLNGEDVYRAVITDFGFSSSFPDVIPYIYTEAWRDPGLKNGDQATFQTDCWAFAKTIADICYDADAYMDPDDKNLLSKSDAAFRKYLRDDQVLELNRMLSKNPDQRCIVSVRAVTPERNWDRFFSKIYVLTEWMADLANRFKLRKSTLVVAIDILYRYYNGGAKFKEKYAQKYGCASLYIAGLWGELYYNHANDYEYMTNKTYTAKEIVDAGYKMISRLNGLIWVPGLEHIIEKLEPMSYKKISKMFANKNFYMKSLL